MDERLKKAYDARHKQAFRLAFDALNEVFPPENTTEYFEQTGEKIKYIYNEHIDNPLAKRLLVALYDYLGDVVKELEKIGGDRQ